MGICKTLLEIPNERRFLIAGLINVNVPKEIIPTPFDENVDKMNMDLFRAIGMGE